MVSGFIITVVSLQKNTLKSNLSLRDFVIHRFARIIPFMWSCILVYATIRFLGTGAFEIRPYLTAFFLWPIGEVRPNVIWTLRHELLFYVIFGASLLSSVRRPFVLASWVVSPILFVPLRPFMMLAVPTTILEFLDFLFNPVNLEFGCGLLVGIAYLNRERLATLGEFFARSNRGPGVIPFAVAISTTLTLVAAMVFDLNSTKTVAALALGLMSSIILGLSLGLSPPAGWFSRLMELLGDASYSIYLIHVLVILIFSKDSFPWRRMRTRIWFTRVLLRWQSFLG